MRSGQKESAEETINEAPGLYAIEIKRHPRDLGVSIVLPATCHLMARREVHRLFPEYSHDDVLTWAFPARYVEVDWDAGRTIVAKRRALPDIPPCVAAAAKRERKKLPRLEDEGGDAQ